MGRICVIMTIAAIILCEAWILFGDRSGNELINFLDGQTHGVTKWWFMKGLADILVCCTLSFSACIGFIKSDKRIAFFYWIIFIYFDLNLIVWIYNYSTSRYIFYAMITGVIIWTANKGWPLKSKLKIV